ncbi:putative peptide chain release factor-like protein, mitochondrial [Erysiphe neolycopersici]|uniref:Putative peptide chain release factor-like protein, mitochondrial n=1 Tax=Erysiphe neolycopersici TaxID=212602 RepID=A0A420HP62_9PEZI|nr:putative peptide chain release factor-like protein, mitochondrial [Erysiphe neolycopersici]
MMKFLGLILRRQFSRTSIFRKKKMPDRPPPIDENEFSEAFLKGSGPGGQKINKTSSAVQLIHKPTGIVVKVQETRSREQNRKLAREKLALKIEKLQKGDESRLAIIGATKSKRKASAKKKSKRKYRVLEDEKFKDYQRISPEVYEGIASENQQHYVPTESQVANKRSR